MKAVMLSIKPKWCELIASGKKTIEIRKTRPRIDTPFQCFIYCTAPRNFFLYTPHMCTSNEYLHLCDKKVTMSDGFEFFCRDDYFVLNRKVFGEFVCNNIYEIDEPYLSWLESASCVDMNEIAAYKGGSDYIYGWNISDLFIYDKPKSLSEFGLNRAPQSWCYVKGDDNGTD